MATPMVERGTGRRAQILAVAAELFAKHGFHGVSIADLGAAVGVSGPALYRHFEGKDALLAEMLISISEHLLAGGQERAAAGGDPQEVLVALVEFQADFALREPELIVVQDRDLANLPEGPRHTVRQLQRALRRDLGRHAAQAAPRALGRGGAGRGARRVRPAQLDAAHRTRARGRHAAAPDGAHRAPGPSAWP